MDLKKNILRNFYDMIFYIEFMYSSILKITLKNNSAGKPKAISYIALINDNFSENF